MKARNKEEVKAYVDGYNACYNHFVNALMQRGNPNKAIEKMEMMKESVNSVLLIDDVGTCQQNVGEKSEKVTNGDMIMALYPNIELEIIEDIINVYSLCKHSVTFDTEWWNEPYRAESEEEE